MPRKGPNKTKFWRKNAINGYGRRLRNALGGFNHPAGPTQTIANLMERAGIKVEQKNTTTVASAEEAAAPETVEA